MCPHGEAALAALGEPKSFEMAVGLGGIEQSHRLRLGDNLSVAEPSDDTGALHNLDVVSVDRRFDRPDNIRVVFANDDERRTDSASPCTLVNSIGGHAGASKIHFTWYRIA
jgi:hypothetical protein